jgi:hypothetical protein
LAGGPVIELAKTEGPVSQFALDGTYLYWAESDVDRTHGALKRVPIATGPTTTLSTFPQAPNGIAVDSSGVYTWFDGPELLDGDGGTPPTAGTITRSALGGGPAITIAAVHAKQIAIDSSRIYWTDARAGAVYAIPLAGGPAIAIADDQLAPESVAVGGSRVFWSAGDAIVSAPIGSCSPVTVIASNQSSGGATPTPIVVDASNVYWTNSSAIMTAPLTGGTPTVLAFEGGLKPALAVDAKYVYWIDESEGIVRIAK